MAQASIIAGGAPTQSLAQVSADQKTIGGNGTPQNPLHDLGGFFVYPDDAFLPGPLAVGTPVRATESAVAYGRADTFAHAKISGIIAIGANGVKGVQSTGFVELTTDEWDAATNGGSGGLQAGETYYVSAVAGGFIITYAGLSVAPGHFISQVGFAVSATKMQLQIGGPSLSVTP